MCLVAVRGVGSGPWLWGVCCEDDREIAWIVVLTPGRARESERTPELQTRVKVGWSGVKRRVSTWKRPLLHSNSRQGNERPYKHTNYGKEQFPDSPTSPTRPWDPKATVLIIRVATQEISQQSTITRFPPTNHYPIHYTMLRVYIQHGVEVS